jgi:hyperosmotically inducible protein
MLLPAIRCDLLTIEFQCGNRGEHMNKIIARALLVPTLFVGSAGLLLAQQDNNGAAPVPADNTKVNQSDRNPSEPTADQQKENTSDRQLTAQIRRAIVKDKSLSSSAHNVKVITQSGNVTLKGAVKSDSEKQTIESKAAQIAGEGKVSSELQVAPAK